MTITIDNRAGSAQLAPLLRQRGIPVELGRTEFGDASWIGIGPDGAPVSVGVEVKTLGDVLACIQDARFAGHQLPGLIQSYDQVWLLVIGVFRARARDGVLEYQQQRGRGEGYWKDASHGRRRSLLWHDLSMFLFTMQLKAGIRVAIVDDYQQAALWLGCLYSWWQRGWDDHSSHLALHDSMRDSLFDRALLQRPSETRCMYAQLNKIGKDKSAGVAKRFPYMELAVKASIEDWQTVEWVDKSKKPKRFSRDTAERIYRTLHGGSNGTGNH